MATIAKDKKESDVNNVIRRKKNILQLQ